MRKVYLFFVCLYCSTYGNTQLVAWQFSSPVSFGNEISYSATTNNVNCNTSVLSRGSGVFPSSLARTFSADNFTDAGNKANAIAGNEYLTFTVSAKSGFSVSLSTLDVRLRRPSTGPNAYIWRFSVNGTSFTDIGADVSFTSTATDGVVQPQVNLSSVVALQNVQAGTTITFRLYAWGATSAAGSFAIGRYNTGVTTASLAVNGTVATMSPTPVTLVSFAGAHNDGKNKLRWITTTERNNLGFEVQRSYDGTNFEAIGFVRAHFPDGNSDEKLTYAYNDYNFSGERQHYRLRQVDIDGNSKISNVVIIYQQRVQVLSLSLYPNPVSPSLNIAFNSPAGELSKLEIHDLSGRLVLQRSIDIPAGSSVIAIDVTILARGQYTVEIIGGKSGIAARTKFVKL